jgi:hypothetical protein
VTITNRVSLRSVESGITPIDDVPDAPTIGAATNVGTSRAYNNGSATVAYTAAATGGTATTFTATSTPGSFTATGASPITVTGLQSATSYTFAVSAANANGTLTSAASSSITATTIPATPSAPTATDAGSGRSFNNGSASVAFTAPATGGAAISSYTVTSTPGSFTASGASSPLTVTGLQSATGYTYAVTATNANGTTPASSASASVTATTVPAAPTIGTFTDGGTGTTGTLSFTAGATGGSAITNYKVSTDNVTYTALSPAQTTSPLSLSGLSVGTATYYIKAVNTNGDSTASSGVSGTVLTPTSFDSIATVTLGANSSTISFSSIPSTYKSLHLRLLTRTGVASFTQTINIRFNSDTAANYAYHNQYANVATVAASNATSQTLIVGARAAAASSPSSVFGPTIIDIVDYANTSKTKVLKSIGGVQTNESFDPILEIISGLWNSTAAINSITFSLSSNNFVAGSTIALYGVK